MEKKKSVLSDIHDRHLTLERIVAALAASFRLSYVYQLLTNGAFGSLNDYYNSISFADFYIIAAIAFAFMVVLTYIFRHRYIIPWALMISTMAVSVLFAVNYSGDDFTLENGSTVPAHGYILEKEGGENL